MIEQIKGDCKILWKYMKELTSKDPASDPASLPDGKNIIDPTEIVPFFNNTYIIMVTTCVINDNGYIQAYDKLYKPILNTKVQ